MGESAVRKLSAARTPRPHNPPRPRRARHREECPPTHLPLPLGNDRAPALLHAYAQDVCTGALWARIPTLAARRLGIPSWAQLRPRTCDAFVYGGHSSIRAYHRRLPRSCFRGCRRWQHTRRASERVQTPRRQAPRRRPGVQHAHEPHHGRQPLVFACVSDAPAVGAVGVARGDAVDQGEH